jgi:hypothetical protein
MSIHPTLDPVEAPPDKYESATDADIEREPSPRVPSEPPEPPSTLPLRSIPRLSRRALHPLMPSTDKTPMPLGSSDSNIPVTSQEGAALVEAAPQTRGKEKQKDAEKWDSMDYAYDYVPVVQRHEGRKNM